MPRGREPGDPVDLGMDGERADPAEPGDPEEPLHVGIGNEGRVQRPLEGPDLLLQELDLGGMTRGGQLRELSEGWDVGHAAFASRRSMLFWALTDSSTRRRRVRVRSRAPRRAGAIMLARWMRSTHRSSARVSESTRSVLILAAAIALTRVAWARTSSTPRAAQVAASQYQPPVDSTTALCGRRRRRSTPGGRAARWPLGPV